MKKISLLLIAFSISATLMAQEQLTASEQAVQQTVIKMFEALSNRDSVSLKNYCSADIQLAEHGQVWNLDTLILKAIAQNQSSDFKRSNTFEYIIKLVGVDYVGLGSDFDGINVTPLQLGDITSYHLITKALLEKGYHKKDITKVLGGTF